jgi:2,4-dienoyl-CoA reductase-like NADH-dependent reductase (Old Yellow Enzyme family)/thioredoxin reductase
MEASAVHPTSLLTSHTLAGHRDEIVGAYERVAKAVRPHGTRLFVQLLHGGRELIASAPRPPAVAPTPIPSQRFRVEPRALRDDEIESIVEGFARAAGLAAKAGLDGVEISGAHNYLVAQFFTPELNRRTDRWGEPTAFLQAVLRAVRETAGRITIGVRLSADAPAARDVVGELKGLADYVHVAVGDSSTYRGSVGIVPPPPIEENRIASLAGPFQVGLPLIATSRVVDPVEADRLIGDGAADAIGMNRALITDPDLAGKARDGRVDEIVRCVACNTCIAHYHAETPIVCAQNPRTGRERHLPRPERAERAVRMVVVGAGPAGLAAAVEAGEAGHEVVVVERGERLGGQIALAGAAPGHAELATSLARNYAMLLERAGVELRLDEEVDADAVAALEPEAVVVATGARPFDPELETDGMRVLQAWDVLVGPVPEGKRVVVCDWGGDPAGLDAAEVLHAAGNEVTLAAGSITVGESVHQYQRNLYLERFYRAGIRIEHHVRPVSAREGAVRVRNVVARDLEHDVEADILVLALGRVPVGGLLAEELRGRGLAVEEAGDVLAPRALEEAVLEGTLAARSLAARAIEAARAV